LKVSIQRSEGENDGCPTYPINLWHAGEGLATLVIWTAFLFKALDFIRR
jgi:hypothetical protein